MHALCAHMHGRCVCTHTCTYAHACMVCMGAFRSACHRHQLQLPSLEPDRMLCDLWQCWCPDHHSHMHELSWCTCGGVPVRQLCDEQHTLPSSPSVYACACTPMRASTAGHTHKRTHTGTRVATRLRSKITHTRSRTDAHTSYSVFPVWVRTPQTPIHMHM